MGFDIKTDKPKTASDLLNEALKPVNDLIRPSGDKTSPQRLVEGWRDAIKQYDEYSMRRYLMEQFQNQKLPEREANVRADFVSDN